MRNKLFFKRLYGVKSVALWGILVFAALTALVSPETYWLAIAEAVLFIVLFILNFIDMRYRANDVSAYVEKLGEHMDSATKDSLMNFPFPMILSLRASRNSSSVSFPPAIASVI